MPINPTQKQAAAVIALILVAIVTAFFAALVFALFSKGPLGDHWPGLFFLLICADSSAAKVLSSLPLLVAFGLGFIVPTGTADWRFYATICMGLIGSACTAFLLYYINDPEIAHRFWSYSAIDGTNTPETFAKNSSVTLSGIAVWYIGIVSTQLGMKRR